MLYACISLDCREAKAGSVEIEGPNPVCPNCGYSNALRKVACIHFLRPDQKGAILGSQATYSLLCNAPLKRFRHGTGLKQAVTCPDCLEILGKEPFEEDSSGAFLGTRPPKESERDQEKKRPLGSATKKDLASTPRR